jgi:hypothetical protein
MVWPSLIAGGSRCQASRSGAALSGQGTGKAFYKTKKERSGRSETEINPFWEADGGFMRSAYRAKKKAI